VSTDTESQRVLFVGGTQFVGRHGVEAFDAAGYDVTVFSRGESGNPFETREGIDHVQGDRTNRADLERARDATEPDIVVDTCAYHPPEVRDAVDVFADSRYVYVSSGSAYADDDVPMREDETALEPCDPEDEDDDSVETYGGRKAEGDRIVFEAAENPDAAAAMSVRPMLVVGPHDYTERFGYWVGRVAEYDRILVPGDGGSLLHRSYVKDLARALVTVAEEGDPGEAYNAADRNAYSLSTSIELIADALDTEVEQVNVTARELAEHDVEPTAFPLYTPQPALVSTEKLAALGWESTPRAEAVADAAQANDEEGHTDPEGAIDRETEVEILDAIES
jgi:nucleoside-diphosphate-sugar epimerase